MDQVLKKLGLLFYNEMKEEKMFMIWMHDGASYHTSKFNTKFYCQASLLCMNWPPQSSDFNLIENLWRIIKIQFSSRPHRARTVEELKVAIQEEWEWLTKEDYRK